MTSESVSGVPVDWHRAMHQVETHMHTQREIDREDQPRDSNDRDERHCAKPMNINNTSLTFTVVYCLQSLMNHF